MRGRIALAAIAFYPRRSAHQRLLVPSFVPRLPVSTPAFVPRRHQGTALLPRARGSRLTLGVEIAVRSPRPSLTDRLGWDGVDQRYEGAYRDRYCYGGAMMTCDTDDRRNHKAAIYETRDAVEVRRTCQIQRKMTDKCPHSPPPTALERPKNAP